MSSSILSTELIHGHTLNISKLCKSNHNILRFDHIFQLNLFIIDPYAGPSLISEFSFYFKNLFFNKTKKELFISKDCL